MTEPIYNIDAASLEWLPVAAFAQLVGWTTRKVYSKIERKTWVENVQYRYDPDSEIQVSISGWKAWVKSGQGSNRVKTVSKYGSHIAANDAGKQSENAQRRLT